MSDTGCTQHVDEILKLVQQLREGWMQLSARQQSQSDYSMLLVKAA